jgi:glycosyltransferase involved in cell wall biosynthesis
VTAAPPDSSAESEIDIVLPCLDEVAALPWVLERIPAGARAIVVDNGSRDGSPDVARGYGAVVIDCEQRGYGAACHAGAVAATADLVAFCDCDASIDPAVIASMAQLIRTGEADLVIGRRRPTRLRSWPLHARVANWELARRVRRRTGVRLSDIGPVRVARREAYLALDILDRRSGYPVDTVVRAADAGWRIVQFDVDYAPRNGRSKVTGTVRGTFTAVRDMSAVLAR